MAQVKIDKNAVIAKFLCIPEGGFGPPELPLLQNHKMIINECIHILRCIFERYLTDYLETINDYVIWVEYINDLGKFPCKIEKQFLK